MGVRIGVVAVVGVGVEAVHIVIGLWRETIKRDDNTTANITEIFANFNFFS